MQQSFYITNTKFMVIKLDVFLLKVSKGGIMIPEKAQQKVNEAVVIAVGPGAKNKV